VGTTQKRKKNEEEEEGGRRRGWDQPFVHLHPYSSYMR
jgi:hypothetical protein